MAAIERDRQTKLKKATKTGGHTSGPRKSTEPQIPVDTRVREYPGQGFAKVLGKLRCRCCKKDLPVIRSSIEAHIKTGKHISNLKKQEASDKSDKAFSEELTDYYSQHVEEKGASISPATHLARFHAVQGASARHSSTAHTLTPSVGYSNSSTRRTLPSMRRQLTQPQSVNLPSLFLLQWSEVGGC